MWMIELATNTITADSRIGIQSDMMGTIRTSPNLTTELTERTQTTIGYDLCFLC